MSDALKAILTIGYQLGAIGTTIYLIFFDGYVYTAWNWLIALPVDAFLGELWPIYWLIIRPFIGH